MVNYFFKDIDNIRKSNLMVIYWEAKAIYVITEHIKENFQNSLK